MNGEEEFGDIFRNFLLNDIIYNIGSDLCLTTGGGQTGKPCVFPFNYKGTEYTSCRWEDGESNAWCSTKVENGLHVSGESEWGYCNAHCPALSQPR